MTATDTIREIIRWDVSSLLYVIQQEITFLNEAPQSRPAANRLEIYSEQLAAAARKIYNLQREYD